MNIFVKRMATVDVSKMQMPVVVVYKRPRDVEGEYVCRLWEAATNSPTNILMVKESLREVREEVIAAGFQIRLLRTREDDPAIVETWMK